MNKLLTTIILLLLSPLVMAQEKQVWACQQEAGTMLNWKNNRWEQSLITSHNILLTFNSDGTGLAKHSNSLETVIFECEENAIGEKSCLGGLFKASHYFFNSLNGKLGLSGLLGAVESKDRRDSITAFSFNCTKF